MIFSTLEKFFTILSFYNVIVFEINEPINRVVLFENGLR